MDIMAADDASAVVSILFAISKSDERSAFGAAFESWAHLNWPEEGDSMFVQWVLMRSTSVGFVPSEVVFYDTAQADRVGD